MSDPIDFSAREVQERAAVLAERANEGLLTDDERNEYAALIRASDLITLRKLKALRNPESNQRA